MDATLEEIRRYWDKHIASPQYAQDSIVWLLNLIDRQQAELAALRAENERLNKLFYLSEPEGKIILRQSNEIERLREQLVSLQSSLDSATKLYAAAMNLRR